MVTQVLLLCALVLCASNRAAAAVIATTSTLSYAGSSSCRSCHEDFYRKWSTSFHGLAMQPFSRKLAAEKLTTQTDPIAVGALRFRVVTDDPTTAGAYVLETGPGSERRYPIEHVMGGKNVFYFLTPLEKGRLQTLPVAYDVNRKQWYDTQASAQRHFSDVTSETLEWRHPAYTFNTSCYTCHVSQLSTNYDPKSDTYNTAWAEPGINCEACHGPSQEHVKLFQSLPPDAKTSDIRTISTTKLTHDQRNAMCAFCHAKMSAITGRFTPGDRYFDHYDLTTLEDRDFHPDGRDLGENYTYTLWLMSPCVKAGNFDCMHCHTSSGRYRFKTENPNGACLPCHSARVAAIKEHSHHPADGPAGKCIACHMPMTEFARMRRSDHSMRPPAPAASKEFGSPNACNLCHEKETAQWADEAVRKWHKDDYQKPILEQGRLIDAARKRDWTRLPEILAYVAQKDRDEVIAASLVRLVHASGPDSMWPAIRALATDSSALVRSSVATALGSNPVPESLAVLGTMVSDDYRLVRVRAASSLARVPPQAWPAANSDAIARAMKEYEASITVRSDDAFAQTNLGSYLMDRGQLPQAVAAFETAMRLRPDIIQPLVNASLAYDQLEQPARAEAVLRKALEIEADSVPAHLNLALLLAALDKSDEAETHLRKVLEKEPQQAVAAYNLAVLVGRRNVDEALQLARDAARNRPSEAKYAYTAAYYLVQAHRKSEAETELLALIRRFPTYVEAYEMLGALCTERRAPAEAEAVYREGIAKGKAAGVDTRSLETRLEQLER